ncbi:uncharacterized protein [Henckelia pumila]|uniref:uncharacterized protein n=1 Tax=Henckelia pumila TaxID=405737 RepID=UPI003C6E08D0
MDIDYAIKKDEPPSIKESSKPDEVALYEKWERSNRLCIMFIKTKILAGIRGSIEMHEASRTYLRLTNVKGVREHIMKMRDITARLKKLEVELSDNFLVHFILCTLPKQYGPFQISYNTHKDKLSINELLIMCVKDEGRLLIKSSESVLLTAQRKPPK